MNDFSAFNQAVAVQHGGPRHERQSLGRRAELALQKWTREQKRAKAKPPPKRHRRRRRWNRAERAATETALRMALGTDDAERRWT